MQFSKENCASILEERFQYLFEEALREEMCSTGMIREYNNGSIIIDQGQAVTHLPLVINGSIKVMREDDEGHELLLYYLELGDTCSATLTCCNKKTKSTIRAICDSDCQLLFIPVEKMEEWMVRYSTWRNFVLESYNIRLQEMLEAIDNLAFHNMEERIIKYLKDKYMIHGSEVINVSHADIANDLNSSRVVVSRIMKKLEIDGLVKQMRNKIEVLNLEV